MNALDAGLCAAGVLGHGTNVLFEEWAREGKIVHTAGRAFLMRFGGTAAVFVLRQRVNLTPNR
jgi:hypothetical protein